MNLWDFLIFFLLLGWFIFFIVLVNLVVFDVFFCFIIWIFDLIEVNISNFVIINFVNSVIIFSILSDFIEGFFRSLINVYKFINESIIEL